MFTKIVSLSRREMEVLNTCLSAEIMKQHLHYGDGASNDRLNTLYSLRDKLVDMKELTTVGTTPDTE